MMIKIELLAPAGNIDVMKAAYAAGADAVYMGFSRFSARAYADNAGTEDYVKAIDFAHLHGKKLYCTVNTLMKERELNAELYDVLEPLYRAGLDAVIVQDLGAMRFIREKFPDLPIHVSTQATITGPGAVRLFQEMGATRVVPARELSLSEIRRIYEETGIEIETFIHGALCYCYSGQCLFSSIVGGRSGNRGRCAQPCRMAYRVTDEKGVKISRDREPYVLSLKDLNTLAILPEILEAGVCSLKIEGRMKKAEYAAGVTSIYRKYLDLYEKDPTHYRVDSEDQRKLFDLFNRDGFTEGYYKEKNGRDMIALREKEFRKENEALTAELREKYLLKPLKTGITGTFLIKEGECPYLTFKAVISGKSYVGSAFSEMPVLSAKNQGITREDLEKRFAKTGDTEFELLSLDGELEGNCFLPVSTLNELKRQALFNLSENVLKDFRRK